MISHCIDLRGRSYLDQMSTAVYWRPHQSYKWSEVVDKAFHTFCIISLHTKRLSGRVRAIAEEVVATTMYCKLKTFAFII